MPVGTTRRKTKGKKKFKNTQFGKRALNGARTGTNRVKNKDGTYSSVKTATFDIPGKKSGSTDVMVAPTIRKQSDGSMKSLSAQQAFRAAAESGDYVRVKGGKSKKKVVKAREKGDKKSQKFSARLGKISKRNTR